MGIFNRVSNIFKSKANKALDNIENPVELLDQKIKDMNENLISAKRAGAEVIGNTQALEKKINNTKADIKDYEEKIKIALNKDNKELAKKILNKKISLDKELERLNKELKTAQNTSETIKKRLTTLEQQIDETRHYRQEAAARLTTADATQKVNEILCNLSEDQINLDEIENKISKKENLANGMEELRSNSLDEEIKSLDEIDLDSELEKYK